MYAQLVSCSYIFYCITCSAYQISQISGYDFFTLVIYLNYLWMMVRGDVDVKPIFFVIVSSVISKAGEPKLLFNQRYYAVEVFVIDFPNYSLVLLYLLTFCKILSCHWFSFGMRVPPPFHGDGEFSNSKTLGITLIGRKLFYE